MKNAFKIFVLFMKIGAFTFGGGYAMIPLIQREVVEKNKWMSEEDILDIIAISESTPGPIAINAATFVGYKTGGFLGAFMATMGVVLPSFLIIIGISFVLQSVQDNKIIQYAFFGVRAGVLALIVRAFLTMYKQCPKQVISYLIAAAALTAVVFFKVNVILVLIGCAIIGLVSFEIARRKTKETEDKR